MRRIGVVVVAAGVVLLGASCNGIGPKEQGCDLCTTSALVSGHVTDAAGRAAAGATVVVAVREDSCTGRAAYVLPDIVPGETSPVTTDANGAYETRVASPLGPFDACLSVRATGAGGATGTASGARVRLDSDSKHPSASRVVVNVVLPAT